MAYSSHLMWYDARVVYAEEKFISGIFRSLVLAVSHVLFLA